MIEKEKAKYDSAEALKMRAELAETYSALNRLQYELFCVEKLYRNQMEKYQEFLGVKDGKTVQKA